MIMAIFLFDRGTFFTIATSRSRSPEEISSKLAKTRVTAQIFSRAWQVDKSKVVQARKKNQEIFTAYEPKNSTSMTGLGLGVSF
jgi:hypothetical protein